MHYPPHLRFLTPGRVRIAAFVVLSMMICACFAVQRPAYNTSSGFFVRDGKVYDANGTPFIAAGINNAHGWDDFVGDTKALNALPAIAGFGFNAVRVIWGGYTSSVSSWKCTTPEKMEILDQILQSCVSHKMVPMVGLWDGSGKGEAALVREMTRFWVDNKELFKKYEKHLMINIANEWGPQPITAANVSCGATPIRKLSRPFAQRALRFPWSSMHPIGDIASIVVLSMDKSCLTTIRSRASSFRCIIIVPGGAGRPQPISSGT